MRIKALFLENLSAKIFSLVFALVLWVVVIGEKHGQVQLNVPLELVNIPEKAVVVSDIPSTISVLVQGPRTLLRTISGRDIRRTVDLRGVGVGWTTIRILPDSIPVPRGLEVLRVTPSTLEVKLDPLKEVNVAVAAQLSGDVARGYKIDGVSVDPGKVILRGGESELVGLTAVRTRPVNVGNATSDVEERVGLELEGLHLVSVSPAKVTVKVKVVPLQMERTVENVRVRVSPQEIKAEVQPQSVKVMVKGPLDVVEALKESEVQAMVNAQGLSAGKHTLGVSVSTPQGIKVTKVDPPRVEVVVAEQ
jgi:YbbR domain-containing protein